MLLKHLSLQNFRSYAKSDFNFDTGTTLIVGPNTAGKSNIIEAVYFLATGKSFRAEKDIEVIQFGKQIARASAVVEHDSQETRLEVVVADGKDGSFSKRVSVNGIARRRVDFAGNLVCVLFSPLDLDILVGSPSLRRRFLHDVLEQVDREYRVAHTAYVKAIRQRNALLEEAREVGSRDEKRFAYWNELLIEHGQMITKKREALIAFFNDLPAGGKKEIFDCTLVYNKSVISPERLLQYKDAEVAAGVTLVGPHRDDFSVLMGKTRLHPDSHRDFGEARDVKLFGSRGQQRLVILQLKLLQLNFIEKQLGERPALLLDDIFSELDEGHIHHLLGFIGQQQTILTTTHKEFIVPKLLKDMSVIELK